MLSPRPNFGPSITHKNQKFKTKVKYIPSQARRQDSVTGGGGGGGRNKFWGAREVYLCEFERGTGGTRNLSQSGSNEQGEDQKFIGIFRLKSAIEAFFRPKTGDRQKKKKVFTEILRNFPAEIRNSNVFSGRKQVISKKKEKSSLKF